MDHDPFLFYCFDWLTKQWEHRKLQSQRKWRPGVIHRNSSSSSSCVSFLLHCSPWSRSSCTLLHELLHLPCGYLILVWTTKRRKKHHSRAHHKKHIHEFTAVGIVYMVGTTKEEMKLMSSPQLLLHMIWATQQRNNLDRFRQRSKRREKHH